LPAHVVIIVLKMYRSQWHYCKKMRCWDTSVTWFVLCCC